MSWYKTYKCFNALIWSISLYSNADTFCVGNIFINNSYTTPLKKLWIVSFTPHKHYQQYIFSLLYICFTIDSIFIVTATISSTIFDCYWTRGFRICLTYSGEHYHTLIVHSGIISLAHSHTQPDVVHSFTCMRVHCMIVLKNKPVLILEKEN